MGDVIVLGAGIAGVCAALQLSLRGADVALLDRGCPEDAASFGNAGVLQAEAMEPYGMPRNLAVLMRMALGQDNGLTFDVSGLRANAAALLDYWHHSEPSRHRKISKVYSSLISKALSDHDALIREAGADRLVRRTGYLEICRNPARLEESSRMAARFAQDYGVPSQTLSAEQARALEPGLHLDEGGAVHWTSPWSVSDPGALVRAYEAAFTAIGGLRTGGDARTLQQSANGGWQVESDAGTLSARHVVLATGAATPALAQRFGYRFRLVHKRGYHQHFEPGDGITRPVVDEANGFVMTPMQGGLRIATGAALLAEPEQTPRQLAQSRTFAEALLQQSLTPVSDVWTGVRPCMPDMLPVVGQSRTHSGLWFHFGHGHQGLTLGPTTARLLAEQMLGRNSRSDAEEALSPERF